jgi:Bacteriophage HK97-gp10, putative tail-component
MAKLEAPSLEEFVNLNLHTEEASDFIQQAVFEAIQEVVGFDVVEEARGMCPVLPKATKHREPGALRDSIQSTVRRTAHGVRARIFTSAGYGGWVELGTAKMSAEPYLWPAFEVHAQRIPEQVVANFAGFTGSQKDTE